MVSKTTIIFFAALAFTSVFAAEIQVIKIGTTYPIAEQNAIDAIQQKLANMQKTGALDAWKKKTLASIQNHALNPEAVAGLHKTLKASVRYLDPTYTVAQNIMDQNGRMIAPAGTTLKPLDIAHIRRKLFFFDGRDKEQVALASKLAKQIGSEFMPILVAGNWADISKQLGQAAYFDQMGKMSQSFGLSEVPVMVSQDGKRLKIESFVP